MPALPLSLPGAPRVLYSPLELPGGSWVEGSPFPSPGLVEKMPSKGWGGGERHRGSESPLQRGC